MRDFSCFIGLLFAILLISCYEDLGNYDYGTKSAIQINGILNSYTGYLGDTLHINPQINSDRDILSYEWFVYDSTEAAGEVRVLDSTQDLDYIIALPQGIYRLLYKVTDIDGYTQIATSSITVSTVYGEGFYVLKEVGGDSDLDLYPSDHAPIQDLMFSLYGERLKGSPQGLFIAPQHKYIDESNQKEFVMFPVTSEVSPMIKVQDMTRVFEYDDLFYLPPISKEQPLCFFYGTDMMRALITDCHVYSYQMVLPSVSGKYGDYAYWDTEIKPAPYVATDNLMGSNIIMFYDNLNGQFLNMNMFNQIYDFKDVAPEGEIRNISPSNLNCEMVYMRQPKGGSDAYALMQSKRTGERYVFTLSIVGTEYNPIAKVDTIPPEFQVYQAENFTISENNIYIYYNVGNQLYRYDIAAKTETVVELNLGGEEICMIDYLFWLRNPIATQWHKFIVATHSEGRYKLYFFETREDLPDMSIEPMVYEGEGVPKAIHYVSPYSVFLSQYPYN